LVGSRGHHPRTDPPTNRGVDRPSMGTPDPDENAPTRHIDPAPPAARAPSRTAATRWVTRVFRPGAKGGGDDEATTVVPPGGVTDRTSVLPGAGAADRTAQAPARGPSPTGDGRGGRHRWWQKLLGPLLTWLTHLISRVVVGPASDLDYAVPAVLRTQYQNVNRIGAAGESVVA